MSHRRDKDVQRWLASKDTTVKQCYVKPSKAKMSIERNIWTRMDTEDHGARYRIIASSCTYFTCGYAFKKQGDWHLRVVRQSGNVEYILHDYEVKEAELELGDYHG